MSDKSKLEEEASEQPVLRRSSRTTRGSVKPVVDLTKDDVVEDPDEEDDEIEEVYEEVKPKKSTRRSSAKPAPPKKAPVKRSANKKPIVKQESYDKMKKASEEEEGEAQLDQEEGKYQPSGKIKNETTPYHDDSGTVDEDDNVDDEMFYDLNEKEMKEINNAFDKNRISDDEELLNADGLRTAMRLLGFEPRGDEIKKLVKKFATKKSGKVTRDGFHKIMAFKYSTTPTMRNDRSNDDISRVFNLLDLDKTGMITLENLRSISKELNEELTDEDLQEMIQEADMDGDFKINKDEFHNIMKKTSLY